ncbi:hypothetical protein IAU59_002236 [Kwoniella sp. CBS 9459]
MSGQGGYNYSPEEQAAAYYAQQGYTPDQIAAALGTPSSSSASASAYGYGPGSSLGMASASGSNTPTAYGSAGPGAYQNVYDADLMQQSSVYDSNALAVGAGAQEAGSSGKAKTSKPVPGQKRQTVIRKGNGRTWEDPTLVDWDANWYRLFVGDVSNDVNERTLDEAFNKYPSYCKCKVVRDRLSLKAKYGFIAFKDPEDFLKAWKEMDGKYVGNRPIRLTKIKDDKYGSIETVTVGNRKAKVLDKLKKNHGKPLDGRPAPW